LGHLTRKIVPNMTYNVFGGTLNPTLLLELLSKVCLVRFRYGADVKSRGTRQAQMGVEDGRRRVVRTGLGIRHCMCTKVVTREHFRSYSIIFWYFQ